MPGLPIAQWWWFPPNPQGLRCITWVWLCIMRQWFTEVWHVWNMFFFSSVKWGRSANKNLGLILLLFTLQFSLTSVHGCTCICLCLCSTAKDRSIICGCYATQVPTRQCGHTFSHFQDRLWDTMSHPEFNPTLPREALKVCHPWQQPYISWGSLCYVSDRESGCSFSYDLFTFIFFEKVAEYLALNALQI